MNELPYAGQGCTKNILHYDTTSYRWPTYRMQDGGRCEAEERLPCSVLQASWSTRRCAVQWHRTRCRCHSNPRSRRL